MSSFKNTLFRFETNDQRFRNTASETLVDSLQYLLATYFQQTRTVIAYTL